MFAFDIVRLDGVAWGHLEGRPRAERARGGASVPVKDSQPTTTSPRPDGGLTCPSSTRALCHASATPPKKCNYLFDSLILLSSARAGSASAARSQPRCTI